LPTVHPMGSFRSSRGADELLSVPIGDIRGCLVLYRR
jgi:hypothetical protein